MVQFHINSEAEPNSEVISVLSETANQVAERWRERASEIASDIWRKSVPACAPSECHDAENLAEAAYMAKLELDLIDEGQEAALCYSGRQVALLRKFVSDNQSSLKDMDI